MNPEVYLKPPCFLKVGNIVSSNETITTRLFQTFLDFSWLSSAQTDAVISRGLSSIAARAEVAREKTQDLWLFCILQRRPVREAILPWPWVWASLHAGPWWGNCIPSFSRAVRCTPLPWPRDTLQVSTDQTTSFSLSTCSHFCVFQSTLFPLFPSYSTLYCTFILFHANNWIYYVKLYILLSIHIQLGFHLLK